MFVASVWIIFHGKKIPTSDLIFLFWRGFFVNGNFTLEETSANSNIYFALYESFVTNFNLSTIKFSFIFPCN